MKIGILGAPGAGKTEFANDLAYSLSEWLEDRPLVLDTENVVTDLRKTTGREYGHFGNHIDDFQIVFKRLEWEQHWSGLNTMNRATITVGTVLDSVVHNFVRSEETARTRNEVALTTVRLQTIAGTFGLLYTDTWDYDYAFHIPYEGEDRMSKLMDLALRELVKTYRAPVLTFTQETDEPKAELAYKAIRALEEERVETADERGVRPSDEAGKAERNSSESVPDVPEPGTTTDDA